jgi:soluble lytic murein transglycosylase-like protein
LRTKGLQVAGALVAAGTILVAWVLPRPAPPAPAPAPAAPAAAPAPARSPATSSAAPGASAAARPRGKAKARPASVKQVEKVLARKMPGVEPTERLRLARAILEESRFAALDPLFVVALIAVESGFDHGAESVRGARGLMQLRPSTLATEAERSKLEGDLDDPVTNVRAGVRYYNRLLRAFGSHDLALMAYNAGPNRILRYLREDGEVPERFRSYPRKVRAEHSKIEGGGVPAGRGVPAPQPGPVPDPVLPLQLGGPLSPTLEAQEPTGPQPAASAEKSAGS